MTEKEFYEMLSKIRGEGIVVLSERVGASSTDAMAAKLILWLTGQLPGNATNGDLRNVLLAALWWSDLFIAVNTAKRIDKVVSGGGDGTN